MTDRTEVPDSMDEGNALSSQASHDAGEWMQRARDQERRADSLAVDLARAISSRAELEARLDRLTQRAERWIARSYAGFGYDDPDEVFRDVAAIVLHLASGQTFPDGSERTPAEAPS